jgi:hypothetical protein
MEPVGAKEASTALSVNELKGDSNVAKTGGEAKARRKARCRFGGHLHCLEERLTRPFVDSFGFDLW